MQRFQEEGAQQSSGGTQPEPTDAPKETATPGDTPIAPPPNPPEPMEPKAAEPASEPQPEEATKGPFVIRTLTISQIEKLINEGIAMELLPDGTVKIPVEEPVAVPVSPLAGKRSGELLDGVRLELSKFENLLALERREEAGETYRALSSMVYELGNFVRRT